MDCIHEVLTVSDGYNNTRDAAAKRFLVTLFNDQFCPAENVTREQRPGVMPGYFFQWVHHYLQAHDHTEFLDQVDYATFEYVQELAQSDPARIQTVWWQICLNGRTAAQRITSLSWTLLLRFEDGTLAPIQIHAPIFPDQPTLEDGELVALLVEHLSLFINTIVENGIDGVHAAGMQLGGEEVFNILIGAFLKIIPQLKPEYHERLRGYAAMCRKMIYPPMPVPPAQPQPRETIHGGFG